MSQRGKTPTSTGAATGRPKTDRTGASVPRSSRTECKDTVGPVLVHVSEMDQLVNLAVKPRIPSH